MSRDQPSAGARIALSKFRGRRGWAVEELFEAAVRNLRLAKQSGRDNILGPRPTRPQP